MRQFNKSVRGKLFKYFEGRLGIKQSTKGWWRSNCPECGKKGTLGIHLENSKVHCFACGLRVTPIEMLMRLEDFETFAQARDFLNIQQEYENYEAKTYRKAAPTKEVELPESFTLITNGDSMMGKAARHRLKKRGFNIHRLALKGVGYCTSGPYAGYLVFPFQRKGKLVYFQTRLYFGNGPKMKNPPEEEFGIGKSQLIYNQDALYMYNRIYWVESITNAETIGDAACAGLGKSVSEWQYTHLLLSPCTTIIILLDPDAFKEAIHLAMRLVHYKRIKLVKLPDGKDVNDLGRKATLKLVRGEKYQTYSSLLKLKLSLQDGEKGSQGSVPAHYQVGPYKGIGRR